MCHRGSILSLRTQPFSPVHLVWKLKMDKSGFVVSHPSAEKSGMDGASSVIGLFKGRPPARFQRRYRETEINDNIAPV